VGDAMNQACLAGKVWAEGKGMFWLRDRGRVHGSGGWSLIELLVVLWLLALVSGLGFSQVAGVLEHAREMGAVRLLAARMRSARVEAVQRSRAVALQFVARDAGEAGEAGEAPEDGERNISFRLCMDGDGDGVRARDVDAGVDRPLGPWESLAQHFPGMSLGVALSAPGIEPGDAGIDEGGDPVRVGSANALTFGADGVGASGTVYLRSRRGRQFAVRVHGLTGRVRGFEYLATSRQWVER
jgi:type II secretory pathway pseudopilin PulG